METVIIGGGVIGLSIARELKRRGVERVCVLERGALGREASWAAAGILAPQVEADEDGEFFRLCYESNRMYPAFAAELKDETGLDIELDRRGIVYVGFDDEDEREFENRLAWQSAAGLNVERLDRSQLKTLEPGVSDKARCGLLFPDDGQVENRKLVDALAASARSLGVRVVEGVEVTGVSVEGDRVVGVETADDRIPADRVVIATGAWSSHIELGDAALPVSVKPIKGQMICYQPDEIKVSYVVYSRRGYLVPRADGRLLAGATAEDVGFDSSTTADGLRSLQESAAEIAPGLAGYEVKDHWAGLRPYADGGLPYIGAVGGAEGLFAAVGHFRNGILLTPITARMIADAVLGTDTASHAVIS